MWNKYPDQTWERRLMAVLGLTFAELGGMLLVLGEWQQGVGKPAEGFSHKNANAR